MSGDIQTRRGGGGSSSSVTAGKLKNRNKKRAMMQELEKQEYQEEKWSANVDSDSSVPRNVVSLEK